MVWIGILLFFLVLEVGSMNYNLVQLCKVIERKKVNITVQYEKEG
jgi:hypothetical protein